MQHALTSVAAAAIVAVGLGVTACAQARPQPTPPPGPGQTAIPQPGTACQDNLDGVLTGTGAARVLLQCSDGTWQQFHGPYPSSDRWLTTGPALVVHGQGRRNPEVRAGRWTGTPQTAQARCSAERVDVVAAGETSPPETSSADPGQPLTFDISDHMFTVTLSGFCLWQRG